MSKFHKVSQAISHCTHNTDDGPNHLTPCCTCALGVIIKGGGHAGRRACVGKVKQIYLSTNAKSCMHWILHYTGFRTIMKNLRGGAPCISATPLL